MPKNRRWTHDELVLALHEYKQFPNPVTVKEKAVTDLSDLLRRLNDPNDYPNPEDFRNPSEVARKINSFGWYDPESLDFKGTRDGTFEAAVWVEFGSLHEKRLHEVAKITQSTQKITDSTHITENASQQTMEIDGPKEAVGSGEDSTGQEIGKSTDISEDSSAQTIEIDGAKEPVDSSEDSRGHFEEVLETWRQRLVDQTRNNRLLNYKHNEASFAHIRLVNTGLNNLLGSIASNRDLEFVALPQHELEQEDEQTEAFKLAYESARLSDVEFLDILRSLDQDGSDDPDAQATRDRELKDRVREQLNLPKRLTLMAASPTQIARANDINPSYSLAFDSHPTQLPALRQIQTLFMPDRLDVKLGKLRDTARRSIEETGVNRLFLALGFLEWYDPEHPGTPNYAPLLVTPTSIDRQSSRNRWRYFLKGENEPLQENLALRNRMDSVGLDLPEYKGSLEKYFNDVETAVEQKSNWKVHNFATVGLFSFKNIELWNDLDPNNWSKTPLTANKNVRDLFMSGDSHLDRVSDEYDVPLILDADSSQLSAIVDVVGGNNLALKGPPGTGKSQTIANLIAVLISRGKKVLFVAEKMAALEVVKSRLDDVGLGDFALELHSSKAHTRNLTKSLKQRWEKDPIDLDEPELTELKELLESDKEQLNKYVQLLNSSAGASGKTIHDVLWASKNRWLVNDYPEYKDLEIGKPERVRLQDLEKSKSTLGDFEANAIQIQTDYGSVSQHPWHWVVKAVDGLSRRQLLDQVSAWLDSYHDLGSIEQRLENLGIERDLDTPRLQQSLLDWIGRIPSVGPEIDPSLLPFLKDQQTNERLSRFIELLEIRDGLVESLKLLDSDTTAGEPNGIIRSHVEQPAADLDWEIFSSCIPQYIESVTDTNRCLIDLHDLASQLENLIRKLALQINIEVSIPSADIVIEHLRTMPETIDRKTSLREIPGVISTLEINTAGLKTFVEEGETLSEIFELSMSRGMVKSRDFRFFEFLLEAVRLLETASDEVLELRGDGFVGAQLLSQLKEIGARANVIVEQRQHLSESFRIDSSGSTSDLVDYALTLRTTGFIGRRLSKFTEAKRAWMGLARDVGRSGSDRSRDRLGMAADLIAIASSIDDERAFTNDDDIKRLTGKHYRALETNFDGIIDTCEYMNNVRRLTMAASTFRGEADFGESVREVLENGSVTKVTGIKRWAHSESLIKMQHALTFLDLSDERPLGQQIISLEAEYDWYKEYATLTEHLGLAPGLTLSDLPEVFSSVRSYSDLTSQIEERKEDLRRVEKCRHEFKEGRETILTTIDFAGQIVNSLGGHPNWSASPLFSESISKVISEFQEIDEVLDDWILRQRSLTQRIEPLCDPEFLEAYLQPVDRSFTSVMRIFAASLSSSDTIGSWMRFIRSKDHCLSEDLGDYINTQDFSRGVKPSVAYESIFWNSLAKHILKDHEELEGFAAQTQERLRMRFNELDKHILKLNQQLIARKLVKENDNLPRGNKQGRRITWTEMALLNVLMPQDRPRVKIRDVLYRAGNSVQILKPCFMMSPNSVAQYLTPGGINFDVLIIDEASQMPPEEAIGSVARARQSIIVGDPMQLPPTPFFNRVNTIGTDLDADMEDESILDMALASFSPYKELRWHYRSRHHDLINFSNEHFYDERLLVFPSPESALGSGLGVRYHKVDAIYSGGGVNPVEAKQVAAAAISALKERPDWSIGVVAINREQTDLIRAEFDQMLLRDGRAREIWESWESTLYPGFIKNLENVQGDERDRIIISTVYGPKSDGTVDQRFGPILYRQGHRRLNVLFTRARLRVDLYSSMTFSDIEVVEDRSSLGVRALHDYLKYAETLRSEVGSENNRHPRSDFEIHIADVLRSRGYEVVPEIGSKTFFIDLGISHVSYPQGFLAGIESDGASYNSAKSAKDRDILRERVLKDLGWDIFRVWSSDWFNDAEGETKKLLDYLEGLKASKLASIADPELA